MSKDEKQFQNTGKTTNESKKEASNVTGENTTSTPSIPLAPPLPDPSIPLAPPLPSNYAEEKTDTSKIEKTRKMAYDNRVQEEKIYISHTHESYYVVKEDYDYLVETPIQKQESYTQDEVIHRPPTPIQHYVEEKVYAEETAPLPPEQWFERKSEGGNTRSLQVKINLAKEMFRASTVISNSFLSTKITSYIEENKENVDVKDVEKIINNHTLEYSEYRHEKSLAQYLNRIIVLSLEHPEIVKTLLESDLYQGYQIKFKQLTGNQKPYDVEYRQNLTGVPFSPYAELEQKEFFINENYWGGIALTNVAKNNDIKNAAYYLKLLDRENCQQNPKVFEDAFQMALLQENYEMVYLLESFINKPISKEIIQFLDPKESKQESNIAPKPKQKTERGTIQENVNKYRKTIKPQIEDFINTDKSCALFTLGTNEQGSTVNKHLSSNEIFDGNLLGLIFEHAKYTSRNSKNVNEKALSQEEPSTRLQEYKSYQLLSSMKGLGL